MHNVYLPARTWVDIYDATGITVGEPLEIIKMTSGDPILASTENEPEQGDPFINLGHELQIAFNVEGEPGAWGMSVSGDTIAVRIKPDY